MSCLYVDFSLYRIVVERVSTKALIVKRRTSTGPCRLSHTQLRRDYFAARKNGDDCYIAAEFPSVKRDELFIVGDNKTYGGFYNAPLRPSETYRIWFGIFVTVDGVCLAFCCNNFVINSFINVTAVWWILWSYILCGCFCNWLWSWLQYLFTQPPHLWWIEECERNTTKQFHCCGIYPVHFLSRWC